MLIPGRKYRIITTVVPGVWNKPREMVMKFIAEENGKLYLDARPKAGTQELERRYVAETHPVPEDTPIWLPRICSGKA